MIPHIVSVLVLLFVFSGGEVKWKHNPGEVMQEGQE